MLRHPFLATLLTLTLTPIAPAEEWPRFRGPDGMCTSKNAAPTNWSETENLAWKTPLPGPGSSSPIVWGERVYVTCYSGYAVDGESSDKIEDLRRHLVCVDRTSGKIVWEKSVPAEMPEDRYEGFITEHGYASSTPVTDGKHVFAFFGKSGVYAFDFDGNQKWKVSVGKESSNREWGSAASPVLLGDLLIVNASEESQSVIALNKNTGEEVWKTPSRSLELVYNTPTLIQGAGGMDQVVISVPNEIWALNAKSGKLAWLAETPMAGNVSPSVLAVDDVIYSYGGYRGVGSVAFRTDGKGDVTESHEAWTSKTTSYVATPVFHDGHLYWIDDRGIAYCVDAKTGKLVYEKRSIKSQQRGRPVYASPALAGDKIYVVTRKGGTLVLPAKPEFEIEATNKFATDTSDFNATPALSNGDIFLRSNKFLYCVSASK